MRLSQATRHPIGKGYPGLTVVRDWRASMAWVGKEGLIVTDGQRQAPHRTGPLPGVRLQHLPAHARRPPPLEIDRAKGMAPMKSVGIDLPHYETFNSLKDAERLRPQGRSSLRVQDARL